MATLQLASRVLRAWIANSAVLAMMPFTTPPVGLASGMQSETGRMQPHESPSVHAPAPVPPLPTLPSEAPRTIEPFAPPITAPPPAPTPLPKPSIARAVRAGVEMAGRPAYRLLDSFGEHLILLGRAFAWLPRRPVRPHNYLDAMVYIGFSSLPIVLLVAVFTGMVMSLQLVNVFGEFGMKSYAAGATGKAIALELGPVLTSLMLAGRAGAGIATEIGTMRITEQIDALESMAVNPVQFLVTPRLVAALIVTPILTLLFLVVAMGGAYLIAVPVMHVDAGQWIENLRDILTRRDVLQGVIKGGFFGVMLALVGCYQGFHARGGGRGVGLGTTRSVVIASVATLVMDYFLSDVLLTLMPSIGSDL